MAIAAETTAKTDAPPRKASREARRVQLIEATIEVLASKGYSRMTLTDVAKLAGLSHGLVNFHFETKEKLLAETLRYLSDEYRENWMAALESAGQGPAERLHAILASDFNAAICTPARLAAWCSFWGEAQSRPMYQETCGAKDLDYDAHLVALCAEICAEGGYSCDPVRAARVLRLCTEGGWLDLMTMVTPYSMAEAQATVMAAAAAFFPRHFSERGLIAVA
jgi:AcrR family transcriptional regulator